MAIHRFNRYYINLYREKRLQKSVSYFEDITFRNGYPEIISCRLAAIDLETKKEFLNTSTK
ncbi:hypothetical protein [Dubosiella newyorkensis]|uniref:hypothetical protein n=1 Tax=Dubosiella newyorkensis TaxID=1862672 RepID=UPI003F67A907